MAIARCTPVLNRFDVDPRVPFTVHHDGSGTCVVIEASDARFPPGAWPQVIGMGELEYRLHTVERDQSGEDIVAVIYVERDGVSRLAVLND